MNASHFILFIVAAYLLGSVVTALVTAYRMSHTKRNANSVLLAQNRKSILVRVKHTDNPHAWYRHFSGHEFVVLPIRNHYMLAQDIGPEYRVISEKDCEVVHGTAA